MTKFLVRFSKDTPISNFMKILAFACGRTGMTKLIVAFRNCANAPKNCYIILVLVVITVILKTSLNWGHTAWQKNCCIILVHGFHKGFLITFGQLYFTQSSATRSKCLTQLRYAHSQVTNSGPKRKLYLLVVDENGHNLRESRYLNHRTGV
jgi:hypothetical protein